MTAEFRDTALISGASSGIGAVCADRLARRGHDLILVARRRERLEALAARLRVDTGRAIEVVDADLNDPADLDRVKEILRTEASITALVNNAEMGTPSGFLDTDVHTVSQMIDLNVTALVHLTYAALPGFIKRGGGAIVNIASVVAIAPELVNAVYGGTKAFVLAFSRALQKEFSRSNVRIQVVLPGAMATDPGETAGSSVGQRPAQVVIQPDEMVDAALDAFDQGELITIPSLPDVADWEAHEMARQNLILKLLRSSAAAPFPTVSSVR